MPHKRVNPEKLLKAALSAALPNEVYVGPNADTDLSTKTSAVLYGAVNGVPAANADPRLSGFYVVAISVLHRNREEASDLSDKVFDVVVDLEQKRISDLGFVSSVDVENLPVRSPVDRTVNVKTFTQYNMQFTIRLRPV